MSRAGLVRGVAWMRRARTIEADVLVDTTGVACGTCRAQRRGGLNFQGRYPESKIVSQENQRPRSPSAAAPSRAKGHAATAHRNLNRSLPKQPRLAERCFGGRRGLGRLASADLARTRPILSTTVRPVSGRAVLRRPRGGLWRPRANRSARDWSMPNKMLVDATHPEETRVVVLRGHRVEEFDFESANRKQLRGNIYLAKVTRVEPSLQAAFVDYGGNRHGFLAFSEIHPDYYQIPVADRQALIAQEERDQRAAEADAENRRHGRHRPRGSERRRDRDVVQSEPLAGEDAPREVTENPPGDFGFAETISEQAQETATHLPEAEPAPSEFVAEEHIQETVDIPRAEQSVPPPDAGAATIAEGEQPSAAAEGALTSEATPVELTNGNGEEHAEEEAVESVGGADALEEVQERLPRFRRQYKIQEVIKRRQVMLVQVVKEERGTKGAALTTYLSLAGRYSVLMPNTAR